MKVKQLIKELQRQPPDAIVLIAAGGELSAAYGIGETDDSEVWIFDIQSKSKLRKRGS